MSTTDHKYTATKVSGGMDWSHTNWSLLRYGGGERHMDGGRLTEVYKSLKAKKIKIDYSLHTGDAIMFKYQTTHLKRKGKSTFHLRSN